MQNKERILVHCSAGRGRTGTLIAAFLIAEHLLSVSETVFPGPTSHGVFSNEDRLEPDKFFVNNDQGQSANQQSSSSPAGNTSSASSKKSWSRISLFSMIRRLREQRWCMVSTDAQYAYCYQFLTQWVKEGETARVRKYLESRHI